MIGEELERPRLILPLLIIDEATRTQPWLEGRTKLTKLVFIAQREVPDEVGQLVAPDSPYHFDPYYYGPFSRELLRDLENLAKQDFILVERRDIDSKGRAVEHLYRLTDHGVNLVAALEDDAAAARVRETVGRYAVYPRSELVRYVYKRYPETVGVPPPAP